MSVWSVDEQHSLLPITFNAPISSMFILPSENFCSPLLVG